MKQLTSKKLYMYLVFSNIKRVPPKEYSDTNEMVVTVDEILPALEIASGEFINYRKTADEINNDMGSGKIKPEEAQSKINELQKVVREFELGSGLELVTVELNASAFTILNAQFDRWGKQWFDKLEDFVSFQKDMKKANLS